MKLLIAVAILVTLALAGSSRRLWAWRRTRIGAAMTTGGWLFVLMGFAIGPNGLQLAMPEQLIAVEPLIHFCLGWVGLVIGLQLDRRLPSMLPASVRWLAIGDCVVSVAGIAAVALGVVWAATGELDWPAAPMAVLLGVAAVGWSADTRTLRREGGATEQMSKLIRATASVGGILAVIVYGLLFKAFEIGDDGSATGASGQLAAIGAGVSVGIGVALGLMGNWLMAIAGRGASQFLVVLLGLTAMVAGAAATMGYSPIFTALWAGAVLCNLSRKSLEPLKRVILEAEQPLAMVLMLVAGVLMDARLGSLGLWMLGAVLIGRMMVKAAVGRLGLRRAMTEAPPPHAMVVLVRQSPVAIALATGYAVSPHGVSGSAAPLDGGRLVAIVVLIGLVAELWALLRGPRHTVTSKATTERTEPMKAAPPAASAAADGAADTGEASDAGGAAAEGGPR